jgi:adenylate cyclase
MNTKLKDGKVQLGELTGEDNVTLLLCYFYVIMVRLHPKHCLWWHCWQAQGRQAAAG